ncbi:GNAT family N-acetyltransferase [Pacificibacter marinus]|uniref:Putative ribosomal N-acetyltransferase YdaF n=1 Tax=Pacificibacter marinus TaxID=658057 RepID=A0A1Y5RLD5_9RHOB|nr:GNAT family protein [Pacificibacter marinus]SEK19079.1 ribosomal-protein-alanine N-acetyltransferase [Pacificibacter marinus]SLN17297.1 Putative ribosomal N-acetyltransferase YdaF [Pacificibacter marinus]
MFARRPKVKIETERMTLRLPVHGDYNVWRGLRAQGVEYLQPWEPTWSPDHLSRKGFTNRVYWAQRSVVSQTALPLFLTRRSDNQVMGALTLDNIRRGPAQAGSVGYWIGFEYARQGYMREALEAVVHYAFTKLDLSRIEAGCLPENVASRGVLEKAGFKYEGVAQSYLQINGRWRNHVLYASLRNDRRGPTQVGLA